MGIINERRVGPWLVGNRQTCTLVRQVRPLCRPARRVLNGGSQRGDPHPVLPLLAQRSIMFLHMKRTAARVALYYLLLEACSTLLHSQPNNQSLQQPGRRTRVQRVGLRCQSSLFHQSRTLNGHIPRPKRLPWVALSAHLLCSFLSVDKLQPPGTRLCHRLGPRLGTMAHR